MPQLEDALALYERGWNVIAAPRGGKSPVASWKRHQQERIPERDLRTAFARESNLFIVTGSVSQLAVLDLDDQEAERYWREDRGLGDELDRTASVKTSGGHHYYFKLEPGQTERGRSSQGGDQGKWDLRAEGGGVIAPPSVHESGWVYEWTRGPEALRAAPSSLFTGGGIRTGDGAGGPGKGSGGAGSPLVHLLATPPGEGQRNNWLTKVAGHYAKLFPWADAYDHHVEEANRLLGVPLDDDELYKIKQSVWNTELAKQGRLSPEVAVEGEEWRAKLVSASEETGWLVSGRNRILVQVRVKGEDDRWHLGLERWMDADLRVLGVVETEERRYYEVEVTRSNGEVAQAQLPASVAADMRRLEGWLANLGVTIGPPDSIWPKRVPTTARLIRYLEAQDAPSVVGIGYLGWHDETKAFVTHDGVIRADGHGPFEGVRPILERTWAPYQYGFSPEAEAIDTLREVLTFHDEEVAAVFASWWAACFLKPQILLKASQFPFMGLEATSESGKTTGFFALMLQLAGNTQGQNITTRAALRDYLTAHRSGIVWLDDLDTLDYVGELLRASTVEGGLTKKGGDNHGQVSAKMRAALVISGESLGLGGQKALLDRAVLLKVGSPVNRRSIRDPERLQWSDIELLRSKQPQLYAHAGTLVRRALGAEHLVDRLETFRHGAGRHADKLAILRLGSRVLVHMLGNDGDDWVATRVDEWTGAADDPGSEDALTLRVTPRALARFGWPDRPMGADSHPGGLSATPAFVVADEDEPELVWFSPAGLAEWWAKDIRSRGARVSDRTESEEALIRQARTLGLGGKAAADGARKLFKLIGGGSKRYWRMTPELSAKVLARSREEDVVSGREPEQPALEGGSAEDETESEA